MRIKLVVGELELLNSYDLNNRSKSGFNSFITTLQCRADDGTGEMDLDSEDLAKLCLYAKRGYKRRLQAIFQRPLSDKFDWDC